MKIIDPSATLHLGIETTRNRHASNACASFPKLVEVPDSDENNKENDGSYPSRSVECGERKGMPTPLLTNVLAPIQPRILGYLSDPTKRDELIGAGPFRVGFRTLPRYRLL